MPCVDANGSTPNSSSNKCDELLVLTHNTDAITLRSKVAHGVAMARFVQRIKGKQTADQVVCAPLIARGCATSRRDALPARRATAVVDKWRTIAHAGVDGAEIGSDKIYEDLGELQFHRKLTVD